jgi:nicotinate-nucleotide adenylyltransferase
VSHDARIGILGGTFDPVHVGHIATALAAHRALRLDRVLVLPSGTPPHRHTQPAASRFHRFAMTALAVNGLSSLIASDLEIGESGPSYTFDTLTRLHARGVTRSQIFFITGADAFAEIATWSRYPDVLDLAHFAVVSRPGHRAADVVASMPQLATRVHRDTDVTAGTPAASSQVGIVVVDAPTPDISSSEIRRRIATGDSIEGLVPDAVRTHIVQHRLYSQRNGDHLLGRSLA